MTEYDDHDTCIHCDKHTISCYCWIGDEPDEDDKQWLCMTPDNCTGVCTPTDAREQ